MSFPSPLAGVGSSGKHRMRALSPAPEPGAVPGPGGRPVFMGQKGSRASGGARSGEYSTRTATKRAVIPGIFHDLGSEGAPRDTFDPKSWPGRVVCSFCPENRLGKTDIYDITVVLFAVRPSGGLFARQLGVHVRP